MGNGSPLVHCLTASLQSISSWAVDLLHYTAALVVGEQWAEGLLQHTASLLGQSTVLKEFHLY